MTRTNTAPRAGQYAGGHYESSCTPPSVSVEADHRFHVGRDTRRLVRALDTLPPRSRVRLVVDPGTEVGLWIDTVTGLRPDLALTVTCSDPATLALWASALRYGAIAATFGPTVSGVIAGEVTA